MPLATIKVGVHTFSESNKYGQCIACMKYIHFAAERRFIKRQRSVKGIALSAEQICNIFATKKILLNHVAALCKDCIKIPIGELNIQCINIKESKDTLLHYNRSLSHIAFKLCTLNENINKIQKINQIKNDFIKYDDINEKQCINFSRLSKIQIEDVSKQYNIEPYKLFIFYTRFVICFIYICTYL